MDFRCFSHGVFEASEPMSAPVSTHARCPICSTICVKVYLKAPTIGKISKGHGWITELPNIPGKPPHLLPTEEVERRLDMKPGVPFADDKATEAMLSEKFDKVAAQMDAGVLAPRAQPTAAEMTQLMKVVND